MNETERYRHNDPGSEVAQRLEKAQEEDHEFEHGCMGMGLRVESKEVYEAEGFIFGERILVMSDPHVGATTGLLPHNSEYGSPYHAVRRMELQANFYKMLREEGPFDRVICVGDVIHGPAKGKITDEILINEPDNQAEEATRLLDDINPRHGGLIVHGTPWHVGDNAHPIEQRIADNLGWEFNKVAEEYEVNGMRFHVKHKIAGSNDPRTLGNALSKEWEAVLHNHARHGVPSKLPHILLRGHRHVFHFRGDEEWTGFILPCLQAWGGNVAVNMTATYYPTVGVLIIDVNSDGTWGYEAKIWKLDSHSK